MSQASQRPQREAIKAQRRKKAQQEKVLLARHAVRAARLAGLQPFCVTIDQKGNDYLPHPL